MRERLDGPTSELPEEDVQALRAFFDGQVRVKLAVWVRHEQGRPGDPLYDHHLMLGVDDADYEAGDMWALELGMRLPGLRFSEPSWIPDIFRLSEVEALCSFGTVVWRFEPAASTGDDALDYRFTYEPDPVDPVAAERFAALLAARPGIRRVESTLRRLWKGDEELELHTQLYVTADGVHDALRVVVEAARSSGVLTATNVGSSLGSVPDPRVRTTVLYEAAS
ncbi:MAG TPA: hypothetical protein VFJ91_06235 [Gaiellaceae bacterium]|nr:hypothetical protein [Gaiellaceae bacterium]